MRKPIKIKVIGIGGAGGNILTRIHKPEHKFIESIAINSDLQDLKKTKADLKIQIGKKKTLGFGSGMNPKIGREAAEESKEEIKSVLFGGDIAFIVCGLGGGTGSGASPLIAELAKNTGALTIGIVTFPFYFEGAKRKEIAQRYNQAFKNTQIETLKIKTDRETSWHLYVIKINNRDELYRKLKEKGIGTSVHFIPVHRHPYYKNTFGYKEKDYPVAEEVFRKSLSLPIYPGLSKEEQEYIIENVLKYAR